MNKQTLYKRDKTGKKVLCFEITYQSIEPNDGSGRLPLYPTYAVTRKTGQLGGKMVEHAPDIINAGKQNRTVKEQAELVFNSHVNSKRDEGYKSIDDLGIKEGTDEWLQSKLGYIPDKNSPEPARYYHPTYLNEDNTIIIDKIIRLVGRFLPTDRTDANGTLKPMKCTALNDTKTNKINQKVAAKIEYPAYGQPKLDGVRCFLEKHELGWTATSSSGKPYDCVARYIVEHLNTLTHIPVGTILDGELYSHGISLQKISGWCRKQEPIEDHKKIQFHVFDVASKDPQNKRFGTLDDCLGTFEGDYIEKVPCQAIYAVDDIQPLHDYYVRHGYEGLIIRNASGIYEYGIRSSKIFKYKNFQDDEFTIVGAVPGKRGAADMVFAMRTAKGQYFEAKPIGTFKQKEEWMNNMGNIAGKYATVRFLTYSDDGIPQGNPVLKVIRDYE